MSTRAASGALGLAFTSVFAWVCCLPIATGAFGIVLADVAAAISPWWPWLAASSLVLLAIAVVQALLGKGKTGADQCELRDRGRRQWLFVGAVAVLTLALLTLPWWSAEITYRLIR